MNGLCVVEAVMQSPDAFLIVMKGSKR